MFSAPVFAAARRRLLDHLALVARGPAFLGPIGEIVLGQLPSPGHLETDRDPLLSPPPLL